MILVKKKLCKTKKKETPPNEKPEIIKTHLHNMIIILEMIDSIKFFYLYNIVLYL